MTQRSDQHPSRCAFCHDVIGVYEPLVWIVDGAEVVTSRAARSELSHPDRPGELLHLACWEARRTQPTEN